MGWLINQVVAVSKARRIITMITRFITVYLKPYLKPCLRVNVSTVKIGLTRKRMAE